MTTYVGNDGVISLAGVDLGELKSWSFDAEGPQIDDTAMGDQYRTAKAGIPTAKGTAECHWDPADTSQQAALTALLGKTSVVLVLYPTGNASGRQRLTLTSAITSEGFSGAIDEIIPRKFAFSLSSGTVVRDTVP